MVREDMKFYTKRYISIITKPDEDDDEVAVDYFCLKFQLQK